MSFAKTLSEKALGLSIDTLPPEAVQISLRAVADTIGVALAGRSAPYLRSLETVLEVDAAPGAATLWGAGGRKASVLHASTINGVAAHALDFDDCSTTMGGHPSAPVVPASAATVAAASTPTVSTPAALALLTGRLGRLRFDCRSLLCSCRGLGSRRRRFRSLVFGFRVGVFVSHHQNSSPPSRAASASALTRPWNR